MPVSRTGWATLPTAMILWPFQFATSLLSSPHLVPVKCRRAARLRASFPAKFFPDEEAEQRHDNVQCALRDEEEWEENVKLHGQPGLHMQTSLNSGRNKKAGQRGVYPEEDAFARQHVRDFGRGQGRQRFAGADGGEQVQGFCQDEVVVVILNGLASWE